MSLVKPAGRMADLAKIRAEKRVTYSLLADIKEQALKESGPDGDRDPFVIHPSEMAKSDWCIRATFYRMSGRPEPERKFNFVLENIFAEGHSTHSKMQRWMQNTGKLFGDWECASCKNWVKNTLAKDLPKYGCHEPAFFTQFEHVWEYKEVRLRVPGCSIVGRADGAMVDTLAEFKTVGLGTLRHEAPNLLKKYYIKEYGVYDLDRLWKELKRPLPGHVRQASIYLWLARELELPYSRMTFIYEFKPNQQVKEFSITLSEDILAPMLEKARKIDNALTHNQPPACEFGGCEQCRAYEEGADDKANNAPEPDQRAGRTVRRGSQEGEDRGAGLGTGEAGGQASGASGRTDGHERQRPDADVQPEQQVGRVRGLGAGEGAGRRVVRRGAGGEAGSTPADPEQGRQRDGDEGVRVGRRVIRRSAS